MPKPYLHFDRQEYADRQHKARARMAALGLDGLLVFKAEDNYWLTGYESDGFCIFGCLFMGADGGLTHLVRPADLGNVGYSSSCSDIRVSLDGADQSRAEHIRDMLRDLGMAGKRIGIQVDTMGLTPRLYLEIEAALSDWCILSAAPDFIRELRLIKSPAELDYFRKAGECLDQAFAATVEATQPGAFEGDIYATFYETLFRLGADLPAHIPPIGGGDAALNLRYTSGRRHIGENDQVTLELGLAWRHYHAAGMGVVLTGPDVNPRHLKMHEVSVKALDAVQARLRPGTTVGEIFDTYRDTLVDHDEADAVLTVCGYTMGAAWPPTWMEQPLIQAGNLVMLEPNMVFFTHMILNDRHTGLSMAVAEQAIITEGPPEIITHVPRVPLIHG
ncbi:M24 family metallopeptidase [Roseovarius sp. 2305UL8-3]|uniref:M24 family metallopeptidase n=1 Tax=Roseovarius conchicola TaxID=3121636 RepID=UPI0035282330